MIVMIITMAVTINMGHGSGSVPVEEECPPRFYFSGYLDENYDVILIIVMTIILSD